MKRKSKQRWSMMYIPIVINTVTNKYVLKAFLDHCKVKLIHDNVSKLSMYTSNCHKMFNTGKAIAKLKYDCKLSKLLYTYKHIYLQMLM